MIDKSKMKLFVQDYKKDFSEWFWKDKYHNEKFKWVAIKHFQDNWNVESAEFVEMLALSLSKTYSLLDSRNSFSKGMILELAKVEPEKVRLMFKDLFNESLDVVDRITVFITEAEKIRKQYVVSHPDWKSHYQNIHAVSVYLWLMYPDKYCVYKYSVCKMVANELDKSFVPKSGLNTETILGAIRLYEEIAEELSNDKELIDILNSALDETCYPDPKLRTLTTDFGVYISRKYASQDEESENEMEFVDHAWYVGAVIGGVDMLKTFVEEGRWENGYDEKFTDDVKRMAVGDRIVVKSAYTRKYVPFKTNGSVVSVIGIKAIGTITNNPGDGKNVSVFWNEVFDIVKEWYFFTTRQTLWDVERKADNWMYGALLDFTFNDMAQDYTKFLNEPYWKEKYVNTEEDIDSENQEEELCDRFDLPHREKRTVKIHPINTILYGAPGTGKTYSTVEYAMAILENREVKCGKTKPEEREHLVDDYEKMIKAGRIVFTTFHQSYGYEDFIQGIRPDVESMNLKFNKVDGVFKRIADIAMNDHENNYVIIIDEINRANISKVFGELITLIEDDKRWGESNKTSVTLPMGGVFAVPNNLYIVGTMNSADKSISLIDTALRRRFDFIEVPSQPELIDNNVLRGVLTRINEKLADEFKSSDLLVGHAYFIGKTEDELISIMNRNIIPLLYEYFYDNSSKVKVVVEKAIDGLDLRIIPDKTRRIRIEKKE